MAQYQTKNIVLGRIFAGLILGTLTVRPAAALLTAPKVRLSKQVGFNPQPGALIADLTPYEADMVGYPAGGIAPTFSAQVNLGQQIIGITANVLFICSGAAAPSPNTVTGWWLDDGIDMVAAEAFQGGVSFSFVNIGDYLDLQVSLPQNLFQAAA